MKCGTQNWSQIVIKSQEAGRASYEGSKVHRLAFDEEPFEDIFDSALIRTIDTRGQVLIAATMWEEGVSWLYDRMILPVIEGRADNIELVGRDLPMESNPMLDPAEIQEQRQRAMDRNPEEAMVRFDGKYIPVTGNTPWNLKALEQYRLDLKPYEEVEIMEGA